jgi:hypothetical protein
VLLRRPAFATYHALRPQLPVLGLSGVLRLPAHRRLAAARFPSSRQPGVFIGLPTPAAGVLLMLATLLAPPAFVAIGAALLSALMISTVRFPTVPTAFARARTQPHPHLPRRRVDRRATQTLPGALPRTRRRTNQGPGRPSPQRTRRLLRALVNSRRRRSRH